MGRQIYPRPTDILLPCSGKAQYLIGGSKKGRRKVLDFFSSSVNAFRCWEGENSFQEGGRPEQAGEEGNKSGRKERERML